VHVHTLSDIMIINQREQVVIRPSFKRLAGSCTAVPFKPTAIRSRRTDKKPNPSAFTQDQSITHTARAQDTLK